MRGLRVGNLQQLRTPELWGQAFDQTGIVGGLGAVRVKPLSLPSPVAMTLSALTPRERIEIAHLHRFEPPSQFDVRRSGSFRMSMAPPCPPNTANLCPVASPSIVSAYQFARSGALRPLPKSRKPTTGGHSLTIRVTSLSVGLVG